MRLRARGDPDGPGELLQAEWTPLFSIRPVFIVVWFDTAQVIPFELSTYMRPSPNMPTVIKYKMANLIILSFSSKFFYLNF